MLEELNDLQRETAAGQSGGLSQSAPVAPQNQPQDTKAEALTQPPVIQADALKQPQQQNTELDALKRPEQTDEAFFGEFKKLAKELGLSTQAAEKLVQWQTGVSTEQEQHFEAGRQKVLDGWVSQSQQLFGAEYEPEIELARRAVAEFGGDELRELLDLTGLGSHPAVVRAFNQIGKQISEDSGAFGKASAGKDKTFTEALYGK